jgi:hypothetical protein
MNNPAATTAPTTPPHKILSSALVDRVEDILRTYSCSTRSSSPSALTSKHPTLLTPNKTTQPIPQVHLWGTLLQSSQMVVSSAKNWGTMPTIVLSVECRLHRREMVRNLVSHRLSLALEIQTLQATKLNRIMCAAGRTIWRWNKLRMLLELCWVCLSSTLDSGASYSFITDQFVAKHGMPMSPMRTTLLVSSPGSDMKACHLCPQVNLKIRG